MSGKTRYLVATSLAGVVAVAAVVGITVSATSRERRAPAPQASQPVASASSVAPSPTPQSPATREGPSAPPSVSQSNEFVREEGWRRSTVTSPRIAGATRLAVLVEDGLPVGAPEAARLILETLADERGWGGAGYKFSLVASPAEATVTIRIATPASVDKGCAPLTTEGYTSCSVGPVVWLNSDRWLYAVPAFHNDVTMYRQYVISHEVGHSLGYHHLHCDTPGKPAPVMQQQTLDMEGCTPNGWVMHAKWR